MTTLFIHRSKINDYWLYLTKDQSQPHLYRDANEAAWCLRDDEVILVSISNEDQWKLEYLLNS